MLSQSERLRKSSVFQRAYSAKNSVGSNALTLYVLHRKPYKAPGHTSRPANDQSLKDLKQLPLVGFAISKKVLKSACKRNRAKRRTREAYRLLRTQMLRKGEDLYNLKRWYALVFVINPAILTLDFASVERSIEDCLSKAQKKFISGKTYPKNEK